MEKQIIILKKKREECNLLQKPTERSKKLFRSSQSTTVKLEEKFEEDCIDIAGEKFEYIRLIISLIDLIEERYQTANNLLSAISQKCITSLSFNSDIAMFKLVTLPNIKLKSHKNPGLFLWIKLAMAHMQKNLVSPSSLEGQTA